MHIKKHMPQKDNVTQTCKHILVLNDSSCVILAVKEIKHMPI